MSGRRPAEIIKGFKALEAEQYIIWESSAPIEMAVIIEGWERNVPYDTAPQGGAQSARSGTDIDYWLYH
ncbi:hypothetical protein [Paenibacillus sp. FSL L8-0463]|uniref:hypothetical protein n=1 Tax=Paenibacillus sp. FSL L8-0463 TaxID=2954687 RepID=UPI00311A73F3